MQRVVMVNPNWEKGFIDKFLVCDLSLNNVEPIYRLDPEHLSHTQYAVSGNHLIRIRHCLMNNTLSEDVFLINYPHPHKIMKAKIGEGVENILNSCETKNTNYSLFSEV